MRWNWRKWPLWSPLALLPFLGAWIVGPGDLSQDLEARIGEALKGAGGDWARVTLDGRDAKVSGAAPAEDAIKAAVAAVAGAYGVRLADGGGTELAPLAQPVFRSFATNKTLPELKGTWPEGIARTLAVTMAEKVFEFGKSPELTSDGAGNWLLKFPSVLADGAYKVGIEISDGATRSVKLPEIGTLTVDTVPPPKPTVRAYAGATVPKAVTGTWAEGDAAALKVTMGDTARELGKDAELTTDKGNWSLALPPALPEGSYDMTVTAADLAGNTAEISQPGAILVDSVPPAAPTVDSVASGAPVKAITGTMDGKDAETLAVAVAGATYIYRTFTGLQRIGRDRWKLDLPAAISGGEIPVTVETADRAGNVARGAGTIIVDGTPPAAPTIDPPPKGAIAALTGGMDGKDAETLSVTVDAATYIYRTFTGLQRIGRDRWKLDLPAPLADGPHIIGVETGDKAGNVSSATLSVVLDGTPPAAPGFASIASREPVSTLAGTMDGKDAESLSITVGAQVYSLGIFTGLQRIGRDRWTLDLPEPLGDGEYAVTIVTADRAGNVSRTTGTIVVDGTPPAAPGIDAPPPGTVAALTGGMDGKDAETLSVTVDSATYIYRTFTGLQRIGRDRWKLDLPAPLADGPHEIKVETADKAGNVSSAKLSVVLDGTPPAAPGFASIVSREPVSTLAGTMDGKDAESLSIAVGAQVYSLGVFTGLQRIGRDRWTLDLSEPLGDGEYAVAIVTADRAGNVSRTTGTIVVDGTPPAAPGIDAPPPGTVAALTGGMDGKDAETLSVTVDAATYIYRTFTGLQRIGRDRWKLDLPAPLADGPHEIKVETGDRAGNVSSTSLSVVLDGTPPAAPGFASIVSREPVSTLSGTMDGEDAVSLAVTVGARAYGLGVFTGLRRIGRDRWTLALPEPLADGEHGVQVDTADAAGNVSTVTGTILIDSIPPRKPTIDAASGGRTVGGTMDPVDAERLEVTIDSSTYIHGVYTALRRLGRERWELELPESLGEGNHTISVMTADRAGNFSTETATVIVDTTPPSAPTVDRYSGETSPTSLSGTMAEDAETLSVSVGPASYVLGVFEGLRRIGRDRWSLALPELLAIGNYAVSVVTADKAGNESRVDVPDGIAVLPTFAPAAAPTVDRYAGNDSTPLLSGTWDKTNSAGLTVSAGGKTYTLGTDGGPSSDDGGRWTLVPEPLKDGIHDVVAVATDRKGGTVKDATVAEVEIDTTGPAAPAVNSYYGNDPAIPVTGTWPEAQGNSLSVALAGSEYRLGASRELTSDGSGNWTLKPSAPLADGIYDVVATAADSWGNPASDGSTAEIQIDTIGPGTPTVNPATGLPVTGTWPEGRAASFSVALDGIVHSLGAGDTLVSDGAGNWTLTPASPLAPGTYDVAAVAADKLGNVSSDETAGELVIAEAMRPPTVDEAEVEVARPAIGGTWHEGVATSLSVAVAGVTYVLGTGDALTSSSGRWTLALPRSQPLKDGVYDVAAETADAAGVRLADATSNELTVDAAGPASPTVALYSDAASPTRIGGTWAEGDAVTLTVTPGWGGGKSYALGTDPGLTSDGQGRWTLALTGILAAGSYDVAAENADKRGRKAYDQTRFEIRVKEPPPPVEPDFDCAMAIAKELTLHPIVFASDKSALGTAGLETVGRIAQFMARCPELKFEVGGHTDDVGSDAYNQALSERRAFSVSRALVLAGVDTGRLSAVGYGEDRPLASNDVEEGRLVNRRIEINVLK